MARIQGFIAMSHSPFWDAGAVAAGSGQQFIGGVNEARTLVQEHAPDAFVIFGPDHFRNFFYDVLPPFCIGVDTVMGFGDYGTPKGKLPCARALGQAIYRSVLDAGFDPALSLKMGVDHGISQPYAVLDPKLQTPMVPIMINASGAPRPPLRRCFEFGQAVGAAIRTAPGAERVFVLASGGLSHWVRPVSVDDPETTNETRDYVVNGRDRVVEYSAARDASLAERKRQGVSGRVNANWDNWFLEHIIAGDLDPIFSLSDDVIQAQAGNGAHEVRTWIAALGAWGGPVHCLAYEPVPEWVTGMGCLGGFAPRETSGATTRQDSQ